MGIKILILAHGKPNKPRTKVQAEACLGVLILSYG